MKPWMLVRTVAIVALAPLMLGEIAHAAPAAAPAAASGYKLDTAGKCRDGKGAFAKPEMCKPAAAATKCRDAKTKKFAACTAPGAEPVPAKKP
jgi:hypothetical protein